MIYLDGSTVDGRTTTQSSREQVLVTRGEWLRLDERPATDTYHPDDCRARAGLDDDLVLVHGIEGPLGADARVDPSLADVTIRAARIAEARAPHFSIHLLAYGIKARP